MSSSSFTYSVWSRSRMFTAAVIATVLAGSLLSAQVASAEEQSPTCSSHGRCLRG
jgi:hypothetical protein